MKYYNLTMRFLTWVVIIYTQFLKLQAGNKTILFQKHSSSETLAFSSLCWPAFFTGKNKI